MIEIKCFDSLTYDERMLRTSVFIEEQKFKEEFDEIDNDSLHLVLYTDGKAAACVRFFYDSNSKNIISADFACLKNTEAGIWGRCLCVKLKYVLKT